MQSARFQTRHHAAVPTLKVRMIAMLGFGTAHLEATTTLGRFHCARKLRFRQRIQDPIHRHCIDSLRRSRLDQINCS